ncbi:MAG: PaREP1 family protein [Desulfurococcales archaeon]|nr:PaREP1 family protein [Desulfurococcales archaeon]
MSPSKRVERYRDLLEKYLEEAKKLAEKGDTRHAAEKLWGAILALVKMYATMKNVPRVHWSRGKIERFIENNVEKDLRQQFIELLDKGSALHEHFYARSYGEGDFRGEVESGSRANRASLWAAVERALSRWR